MAEYDAAVNNGCELQVHRVARQALSKSSLVRRDLQRWLSEAQPLENYADAYCWLRNYNLVTPVERRIEQVHSVLKAQGKPRPNAHPPFLCACVREKSNMELLKQGAAFYDFCEIQWTNHVISSQWLNQQKYLFVHARRNRRLIKLSIFSQY